MPGGIKMKNYNNGQWKIINNSLVIIDKEQIKNLPATNM